MRNFLIISASAIFAVLFLSVSVGFAQDISSLEIPVEIALTPKIISEESVEIGKKILFDASETILLPDIRATSIFRWDFGDGSAPVVGKEVIHDYTKTGAHRVQLTVSQGSARATTEKEIFVFDQRAILVTDQATAEKLDLIVRQAAESGTLLRVITARDAETGFITEEQLLQRIQEEGVNFPTANLLIFYTRSSLGIQAFSRYIQNISPEEKLTLALKNKLIVKVTDENIEIAAKIAVQAYRVVGADFLLLTRPEALMPIFETKDFTKVTKNLESRGVEYRIIDARTERASFFLLSRLVSNFVARGIPTNIIYLLLAFPFAAFVVTFARQVVGLATFGVYAPTVLVLAFLILGVKFGLAVLFFVLAISYVLRVLFRRVELLYIPRIALLLSIITLSFFGVIWFALYFGTPVTLSLAVFPMIVMSTLSEKFLSAQAEEGFRNAIIATIETVLITVATYYLLSWSKFADLLISFPELVLLPLFAILLLGRFTGLRLSEYIRFRGLLRGETEE